jgi:hypothetical protein
MSERHVTTKPASPPPQALPAVQHVAGLPAAAGQAWHDAPATSAAAAGHHGWLHGPHIQSTFGGAPRATHRGWIPPGSGCGAPEAGTASAGAASPLQQHKSRYTVHVVYASSSRGDQHHPAPRTSVAGPGQRRACGLPHMAPHPTAVSGLLQLRAAGLLGCLAMARLRVDPCHAGRRPLTAACHRLLMRQPFTPVPTPPCRCPRGPAASPHGGQITALPVRGLGGHHCTRYPPATTPRQLPPRSRATVAGRRRPSGTPPPRGCGRCAPPRGRPLCPGTPRLRRMARGPAGRRMALRGRRTGVRGQVAAGRAPPGRRLALELLGPAEPGPLGDNS